MENENNDILLEDVIASLEKESQPTEQVASELPELSEEEAISEDKKVLEQKTGDTDKAELQKTETIEPPISWPSEDKAVFAALPTSVQEVIARREHEREAYFGERSRLIAAKEREASELQAHANQAQQQHLVALEGLRNVANQLLPAKFSDIQNEADFLRLKVSDPARASEFEAFTSILQNAQVQQQHLMQHQNQARLDREYDLLQEKFPEFKDQEKATNIVNAVRKAAVDYYGYSPQDVQIINDHRVIPVLRDAMAWREYQNNLRVAQAKKVSLQPPKVALTSNSTDTSSPASSNKQQLLSRASKEPDMRRQAELITQALFT